MILTLFTATEPSSAPPPVYQCEGFAAPLREKDGMEVGRGRVLPLKAVLRLPDGTFADDRKLHVAPIVSLHRRSASGEMTEYTGELEVRDYGKGRSFVFDAEAHWKFDFGTSTLAEDGTYVVSIVTGDTAEYTIDPPCRLVFELGDR